MLKLLEAILKYISPQAAPVLAIAVAAVGMGAAVGDAKQKILDDIERSRTVIIRMEENQRQIGDISKKQDVIIMCISDMSHIQEKTAEELVKMIKEAAKTPVNMPLIERIGDDVIEISHLPPAPSERGGERKDSLKIGVRRRQ